MATFNDREKQALSAMADSGRPLPPKPDPAQKRRALAEQEGR